MQRKKRIVCRVSPESLIARDKADYESLGRLLSKTTSVSLKVELGMRRMLLLDRIRRTEADLGRELSAESVRFWLRNSKFDWWNDYYKRCVKKAQADKRKAQAYIERSRYALSIMRSLRSCVTPPPSPLPAPPPLPQIEELPPLHPEWQYRR